MHRRYRIGLRALLLLAWSTATVAQPATQDFEGRFDHHVFRLQLPAGYRLEADAVPKPGMKTIGFATSPRSDGTRGMIQITLLDLKHASPSDAVTLEKVAEAMIGGVRRRRTNWKQYDSFSTIAGVTAKRIEWFGSLETSPEHPPDRAPGRMQGVMLVGMKDDLAFVLHTQDLLPFADTALPLAEKALRTFTVALAR